MIEFAEEESPAGAPAWMSIFADLMSLLMCFFVLLLSFSEIDAQKYKLVAGSMKNAFGVQQEVLAIQSPAGAAEPSEELYQETSVVEPADPVDAVEQERAEILEDMERLALETFKDVEKLKESLKSEIEAGLIELESGFRSITIRIKEKGSFDSGSASLQEEFIPVMDKLQSILIDVDGKITVEGHTDNIDISTPRFTSNWDLSSARALSVGHELFRDDVLNSERFVISGYADTVPFGSNDTVEGRAANRRVEINIRQPISQGISASLQELGEEDSELLEFFIDDVPASAATGADDSLVTESTADVGDNLLTNTAVDLVQ